MSKQKVWVEKMPKSCWECPCFKDDIDFPCGLSDGTQDYFRDGIDGASCPLHSIKDHDRELVRQVCEKINNLANKKTNIDTELLDMVYFDDVVEKIQKEFEDVRE